MGEGVRVGRVGGGSEGGKKEGGRDEGAIIT